MAKPTNTAQAVSVCMATHNGHSYLADQISTILGQLSASDEIVIIDDASTDDTLAILAAIPDPRIRVFPLSQNVGYVRAFERALTESKNEFLLLSDQDDEWLPSRVQRMVTALRSHRVVAGNLTTLGGPDSIPGPYGQSAWRLDPAQSDKRWRNTFAALAGNRPYFGSAMGLRRDALPVVLPFPVYLRESHDLWIALCGIHLGSMAHLAQPVTARRYHDSNATPRHPRSPAAVLRSRITLLGLTGLAWRRARPKEPAR